MSLIKSHSDHGSLISILLIICARYGPQAPSTYQLPYGKSQSELHSVYYSSYRALVLVPRFPDRTSTYTHLTFFLTFVLTFFASDFDSDPDFKSNSDFVISRTYARTYYLFEKESHNLKARLSMSRVRFTVC